MDIPLSCILSRPYKKIGLKGAITDQQSDNKEGSEPPSKCNVFGALNYLDGEKTAITVSWILLIVPIELSIIVTSQKILYDIDGEL